MSKKRRKKKNSKGAIIVAIIIIIALLIGVVFLFSGSKGEGDNIETTTDPEISTTLGDSEKNEPEETEKTESTTSSQETEETTQEEEKEDTTIPTAAPVEKVEADLSDMIKNIVAHYESYMSMEKGVLFINESEAVQRNGRYELILRSNAKSPNQYVADVYVDMKTGAVEDSMGSEPWSVEIWY